MKRLLLFGLTMMAICPWIYAYDFSAVAPSGQTLYYSINSESVYVTYPEYYNGMVILTYYNNHIMPSGGLTIPDSVTFQGTTYPVIGIGDYAFYDCSGLTAINFPSSITYIGNFAFKGCTGIHDVTIGSSVTEIGTSAFYNSGLTTATLPESVTHISIGAFYISSLSVVNILSDNPPLLDGAQVFYGTTTIRIKCNKYNDYYNSLGWEPYRNNLVAYFYPEFNVFVASSDSSMGIAIMQQQNGHNISCDSMTIIYADAYSHFHFTHWSNMRTTNPDTIQLNRDTSITAFFTRNTYTITASSVNQNWGTVDGGGTALYGDTVTLVATSIGQYHFTHWTNGVNTYYTNPLQVRVTHNDDYVANFAINQYSITVHPDINIHGSCYGGGNYDYMSEQSIYAYANHGYHFMAWSDGDTNNPRIVTLTQDTTFVALFGNNTYVIIVQSSDTSRGIVSSSTTTDYLDSTAISAMANYGYVFSHWNDGNTDNPRIVQVTDNTTYTAYFDYDQFTLTVQSDNTIQGYVNGGGNYNYLSDCTITATPNYGNHFTYWNDGVTENPRTITLTQDTSFTAHFAPNQYTLTVNASEHGTATGSGTYTFGDTITIQAFPDDHCHFTRWNDGNTDNPRQYRIEDNITLTAFFAIDTYTVVVVSSDIVRGMVEASGTEFVYGTPCTVTATAYTGYTFVGWSNGVTANPYTFAVISDVELTALFVEEGEEVYTVTVESADPTMGTVSGGGQALNGGTVTITAIPNEGYRFLTWNDGNTENPRTVTVMGNITYTAYFESTQGIGDINATEIKIYTTGGRIVVRGTEGVETRVYDLTGREMARPNQNGETPVLPSGVYLVKVGTLPARKVVVMR